MRSYKSSSTISQDTSATECTYLLTDPANSYAPDSSRVSAIETSIRDNESPKIYPEGGPYPILSKAITNLLPSIEVETDIPLGSHPGGDEDLECAGDNQVGPEGDNRSVDQDNEITFHCGISKKKFWVIFTGLFTLFVSSVPLLILRHRYLDSQFCM